MCAETRGAACAEDDARSRGVVGEGSGRARTPQAGQGGCAKREQSGAGQSMRKNSGMRLSAFPSAWSQRGQGSGTTGGCLSPGTAGHRARGTPRMGMQLWGSLSGCSRHPCAVLGAPRGFQTPLIKVLFHRHPPCVPVLGVRWHFRGRGRGRELLTAAQCRALVRSGGMSEPALAPQEPGPGCSKGSFCSQNHWDVSMGWCWLVVDMGMGGVGAGRGHRESAGAGLIPAAR